jgi:hypothetical protein
VVLRLQARYEEQQARWQERKAAFWKARQAPPRPPHVQSN